MLHAGVVHKDVDGPGLGLKAVDAPCFSYPRQPHRIQIGARRKHADPIALLDTDGLYGRLHANNIFDGGTHGGYADTYYRFLNVGLKVPFSTGTDWFLYDFSRAYARVNGPLTEQRWLVALAAGRSFIGNGPLLELTADGHDIGDTLRFEGAKTVPITGRVTGRTDFQKMELIHNGAVIAQAPSRARRRALRGGVESFPESGRDRAGLRCA
ncbi:MAG: CehA/McbA family metallohydrolase, partial [Rhodobacteraceae bacterium]|nr:CehA/McbA family metallohydrolase [Paracoccaceae bacterium]